MPRKVTTSVAGPLAGGPKVPQGKHPAFGLTAQTPAREAVGRVLRVMLGMAQANLPGLLEDRDPEFLHDFRVSLRKMRSVLGLVRDVYPAAATRRMREVLGDLARRTNRLRDLDVYLLAREEYLGLLPPPLRGLLEPLFADFAAERALEFRSVASRLRSAGSRRLFQELACFVAPETGHDPSPAAELPVGPVVFKLFRKRYRKICRRVEEIDAQTPDLEIHRLRVQCKKLRYLMEFFAELIPEQEGSEILKGLRGLQNRLGEFNDASVQQRSLLAYWQQKQGDPELALGVGGLVSVLYQRQQAARGALQGALQDFCGAEMEKRFKRVRRKRKGDGAG